MVTPYADLRESFRGNRQKPSAKTLAALSPNRRDIRMDLAWRAYNGELDPPLKRKHNQPDDNVAFNICRGIVDKGVSFLFGRGVTWNLDESQTRSDDEQWLDDVWTHNSKAVILHRLATNGGIYGQAFLKIRVEEPYPRLIVVDSSKVTVETADDDHTLVNTFEICWSGVFKEKPAEFRQLIRRVPQTTIVTLDGDTNLTPQFWQIVDQVRVQARAGMATLRADEGWTTIGVEDWLKPYPPIVACQNLPSPNDYWGIEDLTPDLVRIQEGLNRCLSNINRILRLHAHPKTWTKGMSASQMDQVKIDPDGMIHLPGIDASIQNLEMKSDLASSLIYYQKLREAAYEHSRVPQVSSGAMEGLQYLSAMAMQTLWGPLIEKTDTKKSTYGGLLIETGFALLDLAGRQAKRPALVWPEILPRDAQVEATTAETEQRLGVSRDTLLAKLGYDPLYERRRRQADLAEDVAKERALAEVKAEFAPKPAPVAP